MTLLTPHPPVVSAVFTSPEQATTGPVGRYVHLALSVLADDAGHIETTVHTLEHMTGLPTLAIEAALGHNALDRPLFPAAITLVDGVIVADLPTGA